MQHIFVWLGGLLALVVFDTTAAAQDEPVDVLQHLRPPSQALELNVGTGYTQGFGGLAPGRTLADVQGPGVGVSAAVDHRITSRWSIGVEGQYQSLSNEQNSAVRGVTANFGGTFHIAPLLRGDPWVRLATGYRWLWESDPPGAPGTTVVRWGIDAISAKIGYDMRVTADVALAPVIGADLNVFTWQGGTTLSTAEVGVFIYGGVQARFDLGGQREAVALASPPPVELTLASVPVPEPAAPPVAPVPTAQAAPSISVSRDILDACHADVAAVEKAPKFDFNEVDLLPADLSTLRQIGVCFTTGPLKAMTLVLVGRADPRGTVRYNQALGQKRADRVAAYLVEMGVRAEQVQQTSRGDLDATGTNEATWATDRRVDILLGPEAAPW